MNRIENYKKKVLEGNLLDKEEAMELAEMEFNQLCQAADEIREHFCKDAFDLCTIVNGKSGRCSENCKFCAQSSFYHTETESYPLLSAEQVLEQAKCNDGL